MVGRGDVDFSPSIFSPSCGCTVGNEPARDKMRGRLLVEKAERCNTTKTEALKFFGSDLINKNKASTPPADVPTTMIFRLAMECSFG